MAKSIFDWLKSGAENYNAQMRKKKVAQNMKASPRKVVKTQATSVVRNTKGKMSPNEQVGPSHLGRANPQTKKTAAKKANYGTVNPKTTGMKSEKTAPSYMKAAKKNYGTVNPATTGMKSEKTGPNMARGTKKKTTTTAKKEDKRAMGRALQRKAVRSMGIR